MTNRPLAPASAVLIVDDEPDHAFIARRVIEDIAPHLHVDVVSRPDRLVERLREAPEGALVLLDRLLGGVETYPALRGVRASRPDLRVAVLSAWLTPEEEARALEAGADRACEKPPSLDGWRTLLRTLVEGE